MDYPNLINTYAFVLWFLLALFLGRLYSFNWNKNKVYFDSISYHIIFYSTQVFILISILQLIMHLTLYYLSF